MVALRIDFEVCNGCDTCEKLLGGFKSQHKGKVMISNSRYAHDEEVKRSCNDVISACPQNAIYIDRG